MVLTGLSTFERKSTSGSDDPLSAEFEVNIPTAVVDASHYKLNVSLGGKYNIFGEGTMNVVSTNLGMKGAALGVMDAETHLQISKLNLTVSVEAIKSCLVDAEVSQRCLGESNPSTLVNSQDYTHWTTMAPVTDIEYLIPFAEEQISNIQGLMGNPDEGKLANEIFEEFGPSIVEQYGNAIGNYFGGIVMNIINTKIANLTLDELLHLIES
ncbi:uncharacterized protein [Hetaerina americana]|uniref:uncharacterized protein n=1 Tax=Hetaerina americana TaxID=62018 RepID=UPI003A7F46E2